jgi:hypothetical protein
MAARATAGFGANWLSAHSLEKALVSLRFQEEAVSARSRIAANFSVSLTLAPRRFKTSTKADQNASFLVHRGFIRASPRFEAVNLLHLGKNNDPGHSTNLSLHSRNIAGEARGVLCTLENADGSVVVGHAPSGVGFSLRMANMDRERYWGKEEA